MSVKINIIACNNNLELPLLLRNDLGYQTISSQLNINDQSSILEKVKGHIELRFQELNFYLKINSLLKVRIAGSSSHGHALGVGIARSSWIRGVNSEAYNELNQFITDKVANLMYDFPGRVYLGFIGNKTLLKERNGYNGVPRMTLSQIEEVSEINKNSIHVWGANEGNWNLNLNSTVPGSGQASVIGKQIPGNFGIITMPSNNLKKIFSPTKTIHI